MHAIESTIFERLHNCENVKYVISHSDVINAVSHLKNGKSDGSEGLFSDHFLHATHRFYVILSILYTLFLSHGFNPDSMIMGTMIPIPKNRKQSLCNSSNYMAIVLSSISGKILDWVILIKEESALCSSHLQFGFEKGMSTTQCTYSMLEMVNYYNFNKSNVFVLMLDASKAFDRVNYCKLFGELFKRDISPIVLRLLLYMYTSQTLRVKWGHTVSNYLTVRNGVKQGGVLSHLLFAIYTDSLLKRLEESGVGCHMGGHFTGALAYADDITLLSPSMSGLRTLSKVCEEYATEFDVTFNGKKSQLLFFRGRECVFSNLNIYVCGQLVDMCDSATHFGHFIASTDKKSIVKSAKSCLCRSFNIFMSDFGQLSYIVKCKLFNQYCCSFYGSPLWSLKSTIVESMCVDWRKALRSLWRVDSRTHCDLITAVTNQIPLILSLKKIDL